MVEPSPIAPEGPDDAREREPEELWAVPPLGGVPYKGLLQTKLLAGITFFALSKLLKLDFAISTGMSVIVWAASMFVFVVDPALATSSTRLTFDEGGIRLKTRRATLYVPFVRGKEARLVPALAWTNLELVDSKGEKHLTLPILTRLGKYEGEAIVARFNRRSKGMRPELSKGFRAFARKDGSLAAWCETLRARVEKLKEKSYRSTGLEEDAFSDVFTDRRQPAELRAAAGFVLLALGESTALEIVRKRLGPASPPLVLAMARLAPGGSAVVRPDDLRAALPFLEEADRGSFRLGPDERATADL